MLTAQTVVYHENFESPSNADSVISSSASAIGPSWGISTILANSGTQSDTNVVTTGDTLYLTTSSFSTIGYFNVSLEFSHICKIDFSDLATIEVSNNNGQSWTKLTSTQYLGSGQFGTIGDAFNAVSYVNDWLPSNATAIPTNSWWKTELFDITTLVSNASSVKLRFVLADGGTPGSVGNYGWLLDDIKVTAAFSELIPPTISLIAPIIQDTITNTTYEVKALITDVSGIDTAYIAYDANPGITDTIGMVLLATDTFTGSIPFYGFGRTINYKVIAIDSSAAGNMAVYPNSGAIQFYAKYVPGIGNVIIQESFETFPVGGISCTSVCGTANGWINVTTDDKDWSAHSGSTGSSSTGPSGDHTTGSGKYMYTEASSCYSKTAILESPFLNIDTLLKPMVAFYYHMYGSTMGSLHLDAYKNGTWYNDVFVISGQQHNSSTAPWTKAEIDISMYKSDSAKIRFRGITGSNYYSDMAIDDVQLGEGILLSVDAGVAEIINPSGGVLANTNFNVDVKIKNFGSDTLFNANVKWSLNGSAQTTVNWSDTLLPDSAAIVYLGVLNLNSGNHTIKVWTDNPNGVLDMNFGNDTSEVSFYACSTILSGTYTIGGSNPDFASFNAALIALNQCGINGPVTFNIASGTYNEQIEIGQINGLSSVNTVTFQSASGDSTSVIIKHEAVSANDNHVVKLNGTSYIKLKKMTLMATGSSYGHVVLLNNNPNNLEFSNCIIKDSIPYTGTTSLNDLDLVYTEDTVGNNIAFHYCVFTNGNMGLNLKGNENSHRINWNVSNCDFLENAHVSVNLTYANSAVVEKNNFFLTNGLIRSYSSIGINYCSGSCMVSKNKMDIGATAAAHPVKFNFSDGDTLNPHLIVNNFIHYNQLNQSHWGCAINMFSATYVNVYHNSVSVTGTYTNTASFQIYDSNPGSTPSGNINLTNNIFTNSIPGAKLFRFAPVDYSKFTNDYNILYSYGVGTVSPQLSDFGAWKTATGGGAHSDTLAPFYTSATDLHVNTNQLNGTGVHINGIIDDIDGDIRDTVHPDIGADEFVASPFDLGVLSVVSPIGGCGLDTNEVVTILVKNYANIPVNGNFSVGYTWPGITNPVIESVTDTILDGDTLIYSFNTKANLDVSLLGTDSIFNIKAWASLSGDPFNMNDTAITNVNSYYLPPVPIINNVTSVYGTTATITATSPSMIWWYESDTSIAPIAVGPTYQTPILYDTTTFWVNANTNSCASARVPLTVNVIGFPPADAGIPNIVWPNTNVPSGTSQILQVEVANYGTSPLTSAEIHWTINGQHDSIIWAGSIPYNLIDTVNIDTTIFGGGVYNFQAWTANPNNVADTINTNDTSAIVTFNACLSGTYTIGDTTGAAVYDFPSFNAAKNALVAAGVCGNVTFLVDSGYYEERLLLPDIVGVGPNARITFTSMSGDSTDVTLHYTLSSSAAWTMKFNGDYYTFSHMTLSSVGGVSFGRVMELAGGGSHNEFLNCVIEGTVTTSTSNSFSVIYSNGGNMEYNTFKNNLILNGTYPLYFYGASSNLQKGNVFEGNIIKDFYYYGPYFYYQDSLQFHSNYIENGTSTTVYGVRFYYSDYLNATKNHINIHGSSTHYGMYVYYCDANAQNPNIVANNFISLNGTGTSTWYGIYFYGSTYTNLYYNSVNLTGGSSTSRCLHQSTGSNNNLINNIFSNSGGGYSYYVNTPTALISSDYNNHYSSGSTLAYWSGAVTDLAALQTSSGKESHSVSILPPFTSSADLHLATTGLSALGLTLSEVTDDIDGDPRSPLPTIGADEVPLIPVDAGISNIISPYNNQITNENDTVPVSVVITNFGTDTVTMSGIQYTVNNGTPVSIVYSDTLLPFGSDTVAMPSFISPAGQSIICAKTLLAGDTNFFNDEHCNNFFGIPGKDATLNTIVEILDECNMGYDTIKAWIGNIGVDTINGGSASSITVSYQLDGVSPVVTENMILTVFPGDSVLYSFSTLANFTVTTQDSTFDIVAWVNYSGDNVQYNDTAYTDVTSYHVPLDPVVTNVTTPYGTSATLTAVSPTNDSLYWYDVPVGGSDIGQGSTYTTAVMYTSDTFYVEALAGMPDLKFTEITQYHGFGTGATSPAPSWLSGDDFVEITNLGSAPADLSGFTYHREGTGPLTYALPSIILGSGEVLVLATYGATAADPLNNFYIAGSSSTSSNSMTGSWLTDPQGMVIDAVALNGHTFTSASTVTSNDWSGNIASSSGNAGVVRIISDNNTASDWNISSVTPQTLGSLNPQLSAGSSGGGCVSNRVPLIVTVSGQSTSDVGVIEITQPVSAVNLTSSETVQVKVKNFGTNAQSNIPVSYQIDQNTPVTDTITTTINSNDTATFTFSLTANLGISGNTYQVKAYTGLIADTVPQNDTVVKSVQNMLPNYCQPIYTSGTGSGDYLGRIKLETLDNITQGAASPYYTYYGNMGNVFLSPGLSYTLIVSPGTYSSNNNIAAWIDFNRDGDFTDPNEKLGQVLISAAYPASDSIVFTVPYSALSGLTRFRVREVYANSNIDPCAQYSYGETEDYDISLIPQLNKDAGVVGFLQPSTVANNAQTPIEVIVMNFGIDTLTAFDVSYELNGGVAVTQNWTGSLATGDSANILFPSIILPTGQNQICAYTTVAGDSNTFNDEKCTHSFVLLTTAIPYFDNLEGTDYWLADTVTNQWERGIPSASSINAAHSPVNAWMIDLDANYANSSNDYLYTPRFDFTQFSPDKLKFWHYYHTEPTNDGCKIQYLNIQGNWVTLGIQNDTNATNWYNTFSSGSYSWTGNSGGWVQSTYNLSTINDFGSFTMFRYVFTSNTSNNSYNGWAIDDFKITIPQIPVDAGIIAINTPVDTTIIGAQTQVEVMIKNYGTNTLTNVQLYYAVNTGIPIAETWTGSLSPGDSINYIFLQKYNAPLAGIYTLCAWTNDIYSFNDSTCKGLISVIPPFDAGVFKITSPGDSTYIGSNVTVKVKIMNFGQNSLMNIPVAYKFGNQVPVQESWSGNLVPGDSVEYTFSTTYNSTLLIGNYSLCAYTMLNSDGYLMNDTICASIENKPNAINEFDLEGFWLGQNIPNPAFGLTTIEFRLPAGGEVIFRIINMMGELMYERGEKASMGSHIIDIDIKSFSAGIYYYTLDFKGKRLVKKMIINK
ncbi:GEVED domain-containing protein [candidate division KSB1 bacterium]